MHVCPLAPATGALGRPGLLCAKLRFYRFVRPARGQRMVPVLGRAAIPLFWRCGPCLHPRIASAAGTAWASGGGARGGGRCRCRECGMAPAGDFAPASGRPIQRRPSRIVTKWSSS